MKFKVVLHAAACKELEKLPKKDKTRAKEIISGLSENPTPLGALRLKGRKNAYRIRFGDYRLLYEINATEIILFVFGVAHRKEVYQRLLFRR